jgi:hypothetical protein
MNDNTKILTIVEFILCRMKNYKEGMTNMQFYNTLEAIKESENNKIKKGRRTEVLGWKEECL